MEIEVQLTREPIAEQQIPPVVARAPRLLDESRELANGTPALPWAGAWLEFRGVVRGEENGQTISALEYEAYPEMAGREIRRLLEDISSRHPCLTTKVIHRVGVIPVGETAIYVGVASPHRGEAIALLTEFMNRLKQDVPIWKRKAMPFEVVGDEVTSLNSISQRPSAVSNSETPHVVSCKTLDEAFAEIQSRCQSLPATRVSLAESYGRVLRETVYAPTDLPDCDRSTRDGYAVLQSDVSQSFQVVDTLHAADWKPRQLKSGEIVCVATGAALPCENLRVVMQENIERTGDEVRITRQEHTANIRKRGEDIRAGAPLVHAGARLDAGRLALLASAGCVQPLVGPRLRVAHFTTGDEIIPPDQTPQRGQVRDSNSFLIRGLLQKFSCELTQTHLPENFELAKQVMASGKWQMTNTDVLLVSGGASVGEKDFTRPLLEWLGYEIIFSQVNVRPGRPLIFGVNGNRIAFGLPGNPLSHFVCFHLFIAAALAKLVGWQPNSFRRGRLAVKLDDALNPRETLWPAHRDAVGLRPLAWASSGDVTCLTETNALIRVPANCSSMEAGAEVEFLPADF